MQILSPRFVRSARRFIFVAFVGVCGATVLVGVLAIGSFLLNPFREFDGSEEFVDLSGSLAKQHLSSSWPSAVDPAAVESVSWKTQWSRDSFSSWFRIKLTKDAAQLWTEYIHAQQELYSRRAMSDRHESIECVHRIVNGPPPMHHQIGDTPAWWFPASTSFRATEIILWYTGDGSGVGRAVYSGFDESSGILWVYEYASQHNKFRD